MVVFKETGVKKLMDCAMGRLQVNISGDVPNYYDELSILLTKASYLLDKNQQHMLQCNDGIYSLGSGTVVDVDASELFKFFGIKHIIAEIPVEVINSRNTGLCYFSALGEVALHDSVFSTYMFNDGSTIPEAKLKRGSPVWLKKDTMMKFMPDLYKQHKKSEKLHNEKLEALGLQGLEVGSNVRIKTYSELVAKFGEQILVMGDEDNVVMVDSSEDPDAVYFIKELAYSKLSADYYNNKVGVIDHIDVLTGNITILMDKTTKHNKFIDDGEVQSSGDDGIIFTLDYIAKV